MFGIELLLLWPRLFAAGILRSSSSLLPARRKGQLIVLYSELVPRTSASPVPELAARGGDEKHSVGHEMLGLGHDCLVTVESVHTKSRRW